MNTAQSKVALFIDADNASSSNLEFVLSELKNHGDTCIRKAFGNWKRPNLQSWEKILCKNGIESVQQFDLTKNKNATDIAITISVMDFIHRKDLNVDTICLMTSDCDFTPLVTRVRQSGFNVICAGENKTPAPLKESCTHFICTEKSETKITKENHNIEQSPPVIDCDDIYSVMNYAVDLSKNEDEEYWYRLSDIDKNIKSIISNFSAEYQDIFIKNIYSSIITKLQRKTISGVCYIECNNIKPKEAQPKAAQPKAAKPKAAKPKAAQPKAKNCEIKKLKGTISNLISKHKDSSGWVRVDVINNKLSINVKQLGYKSTIQLIKNMDFLQWKKTKNAELIKMV
ncbi:NYN domain-containing protein [Photobacterium profundum]|uniref:NYN domain-containing protein n=1 Tax=Photobacterium profundum (strain SS9) TaxID=298386 RepID=Q6LWC2_PHOPR|nr:NYN domain-containing protein [Photobacterium profundum]CAG17992.1 conserved protein of unknown functions [Photobacterium profundum SS9]